MELWLLFGILSYFSYSISTSIDKYMMNKKYDIIKTSTFKMFFDGGKFIASKRQTAKKGTKKIKVKFLTGNITPIIKGPKNAHVEFIDSKNPYILPCSWIAALLPK